MSYCTLEPTARGKIEYEKKEENPRMRMRKLRFSSWWFQADVYRLSKLEMNVVVDDTEIWQEWKDFIDFPSHRRYVLSFLYSTQHYILWMMMEHFMQLSYEKPTDGKMRQEKTCS